MTGFAGRCGSSLHRLELSTSVSTVIMKEKIDWEENAARKIADAELSMEIEKR